MCRNQGEFFKSMTRWCSVLAVIAAACYPVQPRQEIEPKRLGRYQQVKIWSGDSVLRWYAVVITVDSITGVPHKTSTDCDSCRVGFPLGAVDSIHPGYRESPRETRHIIALAVVYALVGMHEPP